MQSDTWATSPDDLIDSFFSINGDFLKELDDSQNIHFNELSTNLSSIETRISPVPSVEPEFHGFLDTSGTNDDSPIHDVSQYVNFAKDEPILSCSSSDSGRSSTDTMEM